MNTDDVKARAKESFRHWDALRESWEEYQVEKQRRSSEQETIEQERLQQEWNKVLDTLR